MVLIRPATSGRSVTDSSERRLPTAVIVCGNDAVATLTASTVTLPGAGAAGSALGGALRRGDTWRGHRALRSKPVSAADRDNEEQRRDGAQATALFIRLDSGENCNYALPQRRGPEQRPTDACPGVKRRDYAPAA